MVFFLMAVLPWVTPGNAQAYIMPADQLIGLMAAKFSKFKTLIITQSTHLLNPQDQEAQMLLEEKIWLKSPDFYRSQLIGLPGIGTAQEGEKRAVGEVETGRMSSNMPFRKLFMANPSKSIVALLSEMGLNLDSVAFTRLDGVVAYRIGDRAPESPKLLIEKERFLPLFLSYRLPGVPGQEMVTVRFDNYRNVEEGWYPFQITCTFGKDIIERYFALNLQVNTPIESAFFQSGRGRGRPPQDLDSRSEALEKERLKEMIRVLKEKYR